MEYIVSYSLLNLMMASELTTSKSLNPWNILSPIACWPWRWPPNRPKHVVQLTTLLQITTWLCFDFLTLYLYVTHKTGMPQLKTGTHILLSADFYSDQMSVSFSQNHYMWGKLTLSYLNRNLHISQQKRSLPNRYVLLQSNYPCSCDIQQNDRRHAHKPVSRMQ